MGKGRTMIWTTYRRFRFLPAPATVLATVLAAAGCATGPKAPDVIRDPPRGDLTVAEVRAAEDPQRYQGTAVRWGGTVIDVENRAQGTDVLVLARALDSHGRPREDGASSGRFIIRSTRFLDPAEYASDREITAYGTVQDITTRRVGDYPYRYPVLTAERTYLWPIRPEPSQRDPYYDPFYGPYYSPWSSWGPWPGGWSSWRHPYYW